MKKSLLILMTTSTALFGVPNNNKCDFSSMCKGHMPTRETKELHMITSSTGIESLIERVGIFIKANPKLRWQVEYKKTDKDPKHITACLIGYKK